MAERTETMTGGASPRSNDSRSVEEIQNDIRRTQQEMSRTIDDIQYRLSPEYMKAKAKVRMRELSRDTQTRVKSRVRENPAALALIGAGLFMLFRDRHSDHESDYMLDSDYDADHYHLMVCDVCGSSADASGYIHHDDYTHQMGGSSMKGRMSERASSLRESASSLRESTSERAERISSRTSEKMHDLRDRASEIGDRIGERTSRTSEHISDRARRMRERSRYGMMRARSRATSSFDGNPFILGGVGLVVGALIGAVIPESDRERELMGSARDRAMERAREMARERGEQAKDIARAVGETVVREGKEEVRRQMNETGRTGTTSTGDYNSNLGTSEFRP